MLMLDGAADRRFQDLEFAYYTAWHAGLFSQPYGKGKFPRFDKGAPKRKRRTGPAQTWRQVKASARVLNALFGGSEPKRDG